MRYPPSADLLEGHGHRDRLEGREEFKFGVIRVEGNDLFLTELDSDLDHIQNELNKFIRDQLVQIDRNK